MKKVMSIAEKAIGALGAAKGERAAALGEAAGGALFGAPGAAFGRAIGKGFTAITGWGDYKVSSNSLLTGKKAPTFKHSGDGIDICHREFLFDLEGSVDFARTDVEINPGLPLSFPWLSQIASFFEEYQLQGCVIEYRPSSGMVTSANPALGIVVLASEYNVSSPPFATKRQAESAQFVTSCAPFQPMMHPIECAPGSNLTNKLLVRTGPVDDRRWYDLVRTSIVTQGMPSAYTCGEIWISYHVRLSRPRIATCIPGSWMTFFTAVGTSTAAAPFSGANAQCVGNTRFAHLSDDGLGIVLPYVGTYQLSTTMRISSGTLPNSLMVLPANISTTEVGPVLPATIHASGYVRGYATLDINSGAGQAGDNDVYYVRVNLPGEGADNTVTFEDLGTYVGTTSVTVLCLPVSLGAASPQDFDPFGPN